MTQNTSRWLAILMLALSAFAMLSVSFDAEARRMGGGRSFGRQSSNITQQRQAVTPPKAAAPAAGAAAKTATAGAARSGMSRWLGPIAGIAAGLGIAALLSAFGLSGAFLELISSLVLIGLLVAGVLFIVRRLRQGAGGPGMQRAANGPAAMNRPGHHPPQQGLQRSLFGGAASQTSGPETAAAPVVPAAPVDEKWFVPADFDTPTFLANAKAQFTKIQGLWDEGDLDHLREYLTDDLVAEIKPQFFEREPGARTEIVLLNAELLGIEKVSDGHLASVRYSGMLRETAGADAFRFEEVWNLYKGAEGGWLLAGIQQIPVEYAS